VLETQPVLLARVETVDDSEGDTPEVRGPPRLVVSRMRASGSNSCGDPWL